MSSLSTTDLAELVYQVGAMAAARDDAERIDRIRHFEELKAAIAAAQMSTAIELVDSRRAQEAAQGLPPARQGKGTASEVGLARRISPAQAQRWLGLARILRTELPATYAEFAAGRTSEWRAVLVARESIFLSREHRAIVDAELAPQLARLGDRRVEAEARRAAQRLDPAGAAARARNATNDRRVSLRPAPDTMCWLSALLPVAQGVAVYEAVKQHADRLIATGAQGTNPDGSIRGTGQVMADTVVERLTGQAKADDVPVEINLVMTDTTLFRQTAASEPAIVLGYGSVPAPVARDLALGSTDSSARRWIRRLYLDPGGTRLVDQDRRRREFSANQRRFVRLRDHDTCRTPWCNAPVQHIDHVDDWARSRRTTVTSAQGYCAACNYTKQAAGWRTHRSADGTTVVTVTPTGHRYRSPVPAPPGSRRRSRRDHRSHSTLEARLRTLLSPVA